MPVVRSENEMLNACCCQLADCPSEVVDHGVHHLLCLVRETCLACVIDFLRSNDDHLSAINLLGESGWRQTEEFIQSQIRQIRNSGGGEFLPCWKIREKRVIDAGAQLVVLRDYAKATRRAR